MSCVTKNSPARYVRPGLWIAVGAICLVWMFGGATATADNSSDFKKCVRVVYYTPADRDCLPDYEGRIDRVVTDVQDWYRSEMQRNGFGPMTFPVERDTNGKLVIHVVKGTKAYGYGEVVGSDDIRNLQVKPALAKHGIDIDKEHIIIFQNLCFIDGTNVRAWCTYAGSGNHLYGTAWVTENQFIDPLNIKKSDVTINDNGRDGPLYGFSAGRLGGLAHEFGHALGLPHNNEMPSQNETLGQAVMGMGHHCFRRKYALGGEMGAFLTKAHATILASHPLFKRDAKDVTADPEVVFEKVQFACDGKKTTITGRVKTNLKPHAIVAYNNEMFVGTDYDATSWVTTDFGPKGEFKIEIKDVRVGPFEVSLKCYLENGSKEILTFHYNVDETYKIPTEYLHRQYLYEQFVRPAHGKKDAAGVLAGIKKLEGKDDLWYRKARGVYRVLTSRAVPTKTFDEISKDTKEVWLSSLKWESAKVGWAEPAADYEPGGLLPFESDSEIFDHGIYGHATSSYVYEIGGQWKTFEFKYCLQNWFPGSVVFVVKCDGVEKFRSGRMDEWDAKSAKVDIRGVKKLELIVEDADDGGWADCGNWLMPKLKR